MTPKHYHAWKPIWGGRAVAMFGIDLTKAARRRFRDRLGHDRRRKRRWWPTRAAAYAALQREGVENGRVWECDLGDDCPERMAVISN